VPSGIPVRALAEEEEITAAQLALAWPLAKGDDIAPIPGTCSATRVDENARAADIELTAADIELTAADIELTAADIELTAADIELTAADIELTAADIERIHKHRPPRRSQRALPRRDDAHLVTIEAPHN